MAISSREVIKRLRKEGWVLVHTVGSHHHYRDFSDGSTERLKRFDNRIWSKKEVTLRVQLERDS